MVKKATFLTIIIFLCFLVISLQINAFDIESQYKIIDYKGGTFYSIFKSEDNTLYGAGVNENGEMGKGFTNTTNYFLPKNNMILENVKFYDASVNFIFAYSFDNKLYSWGNDQYGQLGLSNSINAMVVSKPTLVNFEPIVKEIALGFRHTVILDTDGYVYTCGDNWSSQLGQNITSSKGDRHPSLTKINQAFFDNQVIISIASSKYTSYALAANGDVYSWGDGIRGQLVTGADDVNKYVNKPVKTLFSNIVRISANDENVMAMDSNKDVYIAGSNSLKQLGVSTFKANYSSTPIQIEEKFDLENNAIISEIKSIACGGIVNFMVLENGDILSWGFSGENQTGIYGAETYLFKEGNNITVPTKIPFFEPLDIFNNFDLGEKPPVNTNSPIIVLIDKVVSSSGNRTFVLDSNNQVWAFGNNSSGLLSTGNTSTNIAPVLATMYRLFDYDKVIVPKNYLIKPLVGVITVLVIGGGLLLFLDIRRKYNAKMIKALEQKYKENVK